MRLFLSTCSRILNTKPSSGVSLKPPFLALHSGVRMASVMTISSGLREHGGQTLGGHDDDECYWYLEGVGLQKYYVEELAVYKCVGVRRSQKLPSRGLLMPGYRNATES